MAQDIALALTYFYRNTPMLASGIKGIRIQLSDRSDFMVPFSCGGVCIPRLLAAGSAAATLILAPRFLKPDRLDDREPL